MPTAAKVAVADAGLSYDKLYTYAVPDLLAGHVFVGGTVLVPFGRGVRKPRVGMVLEVCEDATPAMRLKDIVDSAGEAGLLSEELLAIVKYLKTSTFCTWFDALRAVVPHGAQYRAVETADGWRLETRMVRYAESYYELADDCAAAPQPGKKQRTTPQQRAVLDALADGEMSKEELLSACNVSPGVLATLLKSGRIAESRRDREFSVDAAHPEDIPALSPAQAAVAAPLVEKIGRAPEKPAYLYGVTGSGKTAVFLHLVQAALDAGKTALVLVPEIGLTTQMISRLAAVFGKTVAVQHSGLSHGERLLQWRAIMRGECRVVVGTRSAVFAPLSDIGVIIVDEEQERSYKSESAPRYDALDIAKRRAARHGALLLLASATPDVENYYRAGTGAYELYRLTARYGDVPLPDVEIVDMHDELYEGNPSFLSRRLVGGIEQAIAAGRQAILLLNRRGFHRVGVCRQCREVIKCGQCSVPMVHHLSGGAARTRAPAPAAIAAGPADGAPPASALSTDDAFSLWQSLAPKQAKSEPDDGFAWPAEGSVYGTGEFAPQTAPAEPPGAAQADEPLAGGAGGYLMCHCCGAKTSPAPQVCPSCGGQMNYLGFGTQKLEDELKSRLPNARVLRMDLDSTSRKGAHAAMLRKFARGEYDILLGTQMVAKGLDFARVGLVGVIGIDSLLYSEGFRAFERVFSLITQVVGRAGRKDVQGRAVIQTNDPDNPVIRLAAAQDYDAFYEAEIALRRQLIYPPFCSLCVLVFSAQSEKDAASAANAFSGILAEHAGKDETMPLRILGPAPMHVAQMAGVWRWRLTVKSRGDAAFRTLLGDALAAWGKSPFGKKAAVSVDFHTDG